jgi:hypothetical protein
MPARPPVRITATRGYGRPGRPPRPAAASSRGSARDIPLLAGGDPPPLGIGHQLGRPAQELPPVRRRALLFLLVAARLAAVVVPPGTARSRSCRRILAVGRLAGSWARSGALGRRIRGFQTPRRIRRQDPLRLTGRDEGVAAMAGDRAAHRQAEHAAREQPGEGPLGGGADDQLAQGPAAAAGAVRPAGCNSETPRGSPPRFAPKGPQQISPGQRPGNRSPTQIPALSGRNRHPPRPVRSWWSCAARSGLGRGIPPGPRALPWADLLRPLRGRDPPHPGPSRVVFGEKSRNYRRLDDDRRQRDLLPHPVQRHYIKTLVLSELLSDSGGPAKGSKTGKRSCGDGPVL